MSSDTCAPGDIICAPWAECYVDGYLPCSSTFLGNLYSYVVYCVIVFFSSQTIYQNTTKLLHMMKTTSVFVQPYVGFAYPMLNLFPLLMLTLASTLGPIIGGPESLQQKRFNVGMGGMAGTIFFSLTIPWASIILNGRCDLANGEMKETVLSPQEKFMTKTGVSVDKDTRNLSIWLIISSFIYFLLLLMLYFTTTYTATDGYYSSEYDAPLQLPFLLLFSFFAFATFIFFLIWTFWKRRHVADRRIKEAHRQQAVYHIIDRFKSNLTLSRQTISNTQVDFPPGWEISNTQFLQHKVDDYINKNIPTQAFIVAVMKILISFCLIFIFSYPLINAIMTFCSYVPLNSPELFVSYITLPIVCFGYQYINIIEEAGYKRKKNISFCLSTLYTISFSVNTFILSIFLLSLVIPWSTGNFVWVWSSEPLCLIFICCYTGLITTFTSTIRTVWIINVILFPIGLIIISTLDNFSRLN